MLYLFDGPGELDGSFIERAAPLLSAQRYEKVMSYRFSKDRILSAASFLLLRLALKENYGIDEPVIFDSNENGKPFLRCYPRIYFNLSHCRSAAACVVSDNEVGVDVQEITPLSDKLACRVLTDEEYTAYKASPRPDELFCELWTVKESWLKKTGRGVSADMSSVSAQSIDEKTLFRFKDYFCCVTVRSAVPRRVELCDLNSMLLRN